MSWACKQKHETRNAKQSMKIFFIMMDGVLMAQRYEKSADGLATTGTENFTKESLFFVFVLFFVLLDDLALDIGGNLLIFGELHAVGSTA